MPKYKYVDGVKYRVVPQSVLGYALVREDTDNPLPVGGTEGQVLTKASNTDYDVEWTTVESGGTHFIIDIVPDVESEIIDYKLKDETKITEYFNKLTAGKIPMLLYTNETEAGYEKTYYAVCNGMQFSRSPVGSGFSVYFSTTAGISPNGVTNTVATMQIGELNGELICGINVDDGQYPAST